MHKVTSGVGWWVCDFYTFRYRKHFKDYFDAVACGKDSGFKEYGIYYESV